jgi:acid phosphatase
MAASSFTPNYDHIVVVVEENHAYQEIIGNPQASYINFLASGGAVLANYHAITHPSEPNYFALYAGDTFGVADDGIHQEQGPTAATILQASGRTFAGFIEAGSPQKHNPWESFPEGPSVERDVSSFPSIFSRLPRVSFVVPNLLDDMHDGTIAGADQWLAAHMNSYAEWAKDNNSLLIVVWDEDDNGPANRVPLILYGAHVNHGTFGDDYNHYDLLATLLAASGLAAPNLARNATGIGNGVFVSDILDHFDPLKYLASNGDLIQALGLNTVAAQQHYVTSGFNEHRATGSFNAMEYLASNPDLIQAFGANTIAAEQHFVTNGFNEQRPISSFDAVEYLASNGDLIGAFGFNAAAAEQHYVTSGFNEHRATNSFDALEYLASNRDLIRAFGFNAAAAEQHYITNGFNEHRPTNSFDAAQYVANYADLAAVFGNDRAAAEKHFITTGIHEGRTDQAPVISGDGSDNALIAKNGAIMTGGGGADTFVFNQPLATPATIADFAAGTDHLQISASGFGHGLAAAGTAPLVASADLASASHPGTGGYFIFDNAGANAGSLYWDATGGTGTDATALVHLNNVTALLSSDFHLV